MSKKKQEQKITQTTDHITYEGNVTLKLAKGNKIFKTMNVKNLGTVDLFKGIALFLNGDFSDISQRPKFLDVGGSDTISEETMTQGVEILTHLVQPYLSSNRVSVTARAIKPVTGSNNTTIGYKVPFEGVVPYSSVTNNQIREIGLFYTKNTDSMLSRIVLTDPITLPEGFNLIVHWEMSITNKGV